MTSELITVETAFKNNLNRLPGVESKKFIIAVSGGVDSMVLLHLFLKHKLSFIVAHVNYQLRDAASDLDEQLVKDFCELHGIACTVLKADTLKVCEIDKIGIQEAARNIRYGWFKELQTQNQADFLVTAHHLNDNIETFLLNALRGSGLNGLKSMQVVSKNATVFRPLLLITKTALEQYAENNAIPFRTDASNATNDYKRNAIRNQLAPQLAAIQSNYELSFQNTIQNLQSDFDYFSASLEKEAIAHLSKEDQADIVANYASLHPRLLLHIIEQYGFSSNTLVDLLKTTQTGRAFQSKTHRMLVDRGRLLFSQHAVSSKNVFYIESLGDYVFNEALNLTLSEVDIFDEPTIEANCAMLSADQITFPLTVRIWQPGDKFVPFGMKGQKKVSDFLTDKKLSLFEKERTYVVLSDDSIVWVVGHRISEKYKVHKNSKKILKIVTSNLF